MEVLKKLILLSFLPFNLWAQIKVVDSLTKLPIEGVTIVLDGSTDIQITNEQGEFDVSKLNNAKLITFTAIGYQKKISDIKKVQELDRVYLNPVTYLLNEVNISGKRYRKHLIGGNMSLLHGSNSYGGYNYEEARFFPNEYKREGKIIAVHYFIIKKQSFEKKSKVDLSNAFGVGVYEANEDGSPGKPLLQDDLVVRAKEHAEWFEVNLEQYNLLMPKHGFVVSFKVFSASFYNAKDARITNKNFVAPVLALKTYLRKSTESWKRRGFAISNWTRDTRSHFGIRAMIGVAK
ncbi:MAG: carboxypeptidase-like regulatory domain-containing protein [Bacteroidota bacterium]